MEVLSVCGVGTRSGQCLARYQYNNVFLPCNNLTPAFTRERVVMGEEQASC